MIEGILLLVFCFGCFPGILALLAVAFRDNSKWIWRALVAYLLLFNCCLPALCAPFALFGGQ